MFQESDFCQRPAFEFGGMISLTLMAEKAGQKRLEVQLKVVGAPEKREKEDQQTPEINLSNRTTLRKLARGELTEDVIAAELKKIIPPEIFESKVCKAEEYVISFLEELRNEIGDSEEKLQIFLHGDVSK